MESKEIFFVEGQTVGLSEHLERVPAGRDPFLLFELNEIKRKLVNREADLKRKEKECAVYQAESTKWQREHDLAKTEVVSVRERNEQLQQSLVGARSTVTVQNTKLKDYEESTKIMEKLKKVEAAFSRVNEKAKSLETEAEELRKPSVAADTAIRRLEVFLRLSKQSEDKLKTEVMALQLSMDKCQEEKENIEKETDELRKRIGNSQSLSALYDKDLSKMKVKLIDKERIIADLTQDVNRIQSDLKIKAESNFILRGQLEESDEINLKNEKFSGLEAKHLLLLQKSNELTVTVEGHSDLLRKMDTTRINLKTQLDAANKILATQSGEIASLKNSMAADKFELKILRKETNKSRAHSKDSISSGNGQNDGVSPSTNENENENEMGLLKELLVTMMREKQQTADLLANEKKLRKIAEDNVRAHQVRISFLLEQLDQLSKFQSIWSEQKIILKTEIQALSKINKNFRKLLIDEPSPKTHVTDSNQIIISENPDFIGISGLESLEELSGVSKETKLDQNSLSENGNLGEDSVLMNEKTVLESESESDSTARVIERAMFDMICYLSSRSGPSSCSGSGSFVNSSGGAISSSTIGKKNGSKNSNTNLGGLFGINQCENGFYELIYTDICDEKNRDNGNDKNDKNNKNKRKLKDDNGEKDNENGNNDNNKNKNIDGYELLKELDLPSFLESCQKNNSNNVPITSFLDKIVTILNYYKTYTKEINCKLCASRMENAILLSRFQVYKSHSDSSKMKYTKERIYKQVFIY